MRHIVCLAARCTFYRFLAVHRSEMRLVSQRQIYLLKFISTERLFD